MTAFTVRLGQESQVGCHRIRFRGEDLSFELSPLFVFLSYFFLFELVGLVACLLGLTNPLTAFVDKERTSPRLSLVNVPALNFLLRSEIFVSEDGQLRSAPLILDYVPLTRSLVDPGQAIRAGSPLLARIDVSIPGFLASTNLPPIQLPPNVLFPQWLSRKRRLVLRIHLWKNK